MHIDTDRMLEFLTELLHIPSPSGYTEEAIAYVRRRFAHLPLEVALTPKGALVATWPGERDDAPRALTAHVDTLGAMVQQIKANGRLQLVAIGGLQWSSVEGEGVTVHAGDGKAWRGALLPVTASGHATPPDQRHAKRDFDSMEVRIDALSTSQQETEDLGVRVGDFVSFDPRVEIGAAGFVRSRFLDDKACVAAIFAALEALHSAGLRPKQRTTIHISNYEEVGHGAAAGLPADLADLVTVDMAVVAPGQASDEFSVTICARDGGGPYDLSLRRELEGLAKAQSLRWCTDVYLYYQSDGEAYWYAGGNVRVGLIGPGVDASHHYERTHREALENTAYLIAAYLLS
jgi:putative aminopeptidase FrvX